MTETIKEKLEKLDEHFRSTNTEFNERERLYSRAIKLNEEVGELMEAILHETDQNQRQKDTVVDFDEELADVIICSLLLSMNREKNIWTVVEQKLTKAMNRCNIE